MQSNKPTGVFLSYTRCSTDEQSKKGNSHDYQIAGIRQSGVVRIGALSECGHFADTVTGTKFDNRIEGLDAAYSLCEKQRGKVAFLFVYRWDRLGRDVSECFQCIKKFRAVGVEVNCPDEWIDFSDPSYPLILSVKFGMAQSESMRISDRTRDGIHQAKVSGFWTAMAPVGYRKGAPRLVNGKERRVCEIEPVTGEIVRKCFEEYAAGETKANLQSKYVDKLGIAKSQFGRLFSNPFYAGLIPIRAHRSSIAQMVVGQHEPLISRELFEQCQRVAASVVHTTTGKTWTVGDGGSEFYLKGVLRCPVTGRNMTAYYSKGKSGGRFPYYASQKLKGGQIIPAARAHGLVLSALSGMRIDPELSNSLRKEAERQLSARLSEATSAANRARTGLEKSRTRLENMQGQFADGHLSAKEYREIKAGFDRDSIKFERELQEAQGRMEAYDDTIDRVLTLLSGIDTVFAASDYRTKHRILKAVFPSGLNLDVKAQKVRTPEVNEIILSICSGSISCETLEIENGVAITDNPVGGGSPDRYRTHFLLLKMLFAA